jgi:aminopeptidase N
LDLTVNPSSESYGGSTTIDLQIIKETPTLVFDLDNRFFVSEIFINGKNMPYNHYNGQIHIPGTPNFSLGNYSVKIFYNGQPKIAKNPPWDGGIQWSKDAQGRPWVAMSCQEDGANIFFPCKDHPSDEPNEGADLIITVPKGLVVGGPGILISTEEKKRQTVFHWKTNYTINNYCIVFNIGYYKPYVKSYTTIEGNTVPMEYYVLDYNYDKADKHLELLARSTKMLEKYFGEYPFVKEKIGLIETPHLGMEHQTMNAYGNKYRYEKVGDVDFDWLMHHEFGHEWWANKVSNIDWAHMWVQEGITSFADALFTEEYPLCREKKGLMEKKLTTVISTGKVHSLCIPFDL